MGDFLNHVSPTPPGAEMRARHFSFAATYQPLNHGSFGTFPKPVLEYQQRLQLESESRPDKWIRYTYLDLLKKSRSAIAPLLGASPREVVLVPNATSGVNTILRNLAFSQDDVIITFSTIYGANKKTIQSLSETCPVSSHQIDITYPITDNDIVGKFKSAIREIGTAGRRPRLAMFDTVLTFPGVKFPWEALVEICQKQNLWSFLDAAHGVGHLDLTHLSNISPDFMISNCYKYVIIPVEVDRYVHDVLIYIYRWLMVPRGCAVLYVPFRNQHMITSTLPTSWGYLPREDRQTVSPQLYFDKLFNKVSTIDSTPYCCIPAALQFRSEVCGGEERIRDYCFKLAKEGGARMATILGTSTISGDPKCCFATVRLPVTHAELGFDEDGRALAKWMQELTPAQYETYIPIKFYADSFWCRISAQVYLTIGDFEWAAKTLVQICDRARSGEWRGQLPAVRKYE